ncbi:MAG: hypothetical protein R3A79_30490 [Nannocystaceae bacterium]
MRTLASLPTLLAVALAVACGGDKPSNTGKDADKAAAQESSATPDKAAESSDEKAAETAGKEAGDSSATPTSDSNAEAADPAATSSGGDLADAATTGGDEAAATGGASADAVESGEPAVEEKSEEDKKKEEIASLLKTVSNKRTSDAKADKALADAEALGAEVRALAEAANDRGDALSDDEARSTKYLEWARDKDTTYPDPSFNLAKGSVLSGNVAATIAHLEEVKKRGGTKLLKTVGYDPLFEVVKDDPKVQALIR